MKNHYYPLIIVNTMFFIMLLSELLADDAIDWFDLWWLPLAVGVVLLIVSFTMGFSDEDAKPWIIFTGGSILSVLLWLGIFILLSTAELI